ncbi:2Fe-2S iron-sulfur cluster binding domain-containing protein [bacterium]|nr:2Fe-2S iron-sulfur cluster binding domain-containing protein [bacterium]
MKLTINGAVHDVDVEPEMPLLWVIRDELNLTGTKYSCGVAACGACTVLVDGQPVRSCSFPVGGVSETAAITTIEGVAQGGALSRVQQAWIEHQTPQCGFCQSGQILAATALLNEIPQPTDEEIDARMSNICRCGSYPRIRAAIHAAAKA